MEETRSFSQVGQTCNRCTEQTITITEYKNYNDNISSACRLCNKCEQCGSSRTPSGIWTITSCHHGELEEDRPYILSIFSPHCSAMHTLRTDRQRSYYQEAGDRQCTVARDCSYVVLALYVSKSGPALLTPDQLTQHQSRWL